jgi:hypothetical protein
MTLFRLLVSVFRRLPRRPQNGLLAMPNDPAFVSAFASGTYTFDSYPDEIASLDARKDTFLG